MRVLEIVVTVLLVIELIFIWIFPYGHYNYPDDRYGNVWYAEYLWSDLELLIMHLPLVMAGIFALIFSRSIIWSAILVFLALGYAFFIGIAIFLSVQDFQASYGALLLLFLAGSLFLKAGLRFIQCNGVRIRLDSVRRSGTK